jgi:hypothetical protein
MPCYCKVCVTHRAAHSEVKTLRHLKHVCQSARDEADVSSNRVDLLLDQMQHDPSTVSVQELRRAINEDRCRQVCKQESATALVSASHASAISALETWQDRALELTEEITLADKLRNPK